MCMKNNEQLINNIYSYAKKNISYIYYLKYSYIRRKNKISNLITNIDNTIKHHVTILIIEYIES